MNKLIFLLVVMLFSFSCKKENEKMLVARNMQDFFEKIKNDSSEIDLPFPPPGGVPYYSSNNFIIDKDGKIFHYKLNLPKINTCQQNFDDELRPKFIGLMPKDIVEIPEKEVIDYIKLNITSSFNSNGVTFASARETFHSPNIAKGISLLEADKEKKWLCIIRTMTDEEKIVMSYRANKLAYDPNTIKWDTTKIKLPVLKPFKAQKDTP